MARHRRQPITAQPRLAGAAPKPTPDEVTSGLEAALAELQADGAPDEAEEAAVADAKPAVESDQADDDVGNDDAEPVADGDDDVGEDEPDPAPVNTAPREKTLHELNLEARAIDRYHAEQRQAAEDLIREQVEPMLVGIQKPRQRYRRYQKNLRPPVLS